MSEATGVPPSPSGAGEGGGASGAEDLNAQWAAVMQAYAGAQGKQPAISAGNAFVAGTLPLMPAFAQPFMYPAPLFYGGVPALHPAYTALAVGAEGGEGKAANGDREGGSQDDNSDDEGGEGEKEGEEGQSAKKKAAAGSESKGGGASGSALGKRKGSEAGGAGGLGVKSQSSAALSLLASAAANKPGQGAAAAAAAAVAAAAAAQGANLTDLWGSLQGQQVVAPAPDLARMASDAQMQQLLAGGNLDEREAKRLRRKQSNRESARRSRLRKQAECEALARQVKELITENSRLKEEKLQMQAQIEILNHKLSMTSALHMTINQSDMDKIQADLRARQSAEAASMAAAMAQVNALTNGTASLGTAALGGGGKSEGDLGGAGSEDPDSEATSDGNN